MKSKIKIIQVKLNIQDVAEQKGVANPFALARESGLNYAICYRLWHQQTTQVSLPTLAKVCSALACEPGDLLVRHSSSNAPQRKAVH